MAAVATTTAKSAIDKKLNDIDLRMNAKNKCLTSLVKIYHEFGQYANQSNVKADEVDEGCRRGVSSCQFRRDNLGPIKKIFNSIIGLFSQRSNAK